MVRPARSRDEPDLAGLLPSWELALRAERKSPQTLKAYGDGVRAFLTWCGREQAGTAVVRRGKGGKDRVVPYGPEAARSLDRYLRQRRTHRLAASADLWLGDRGKRFSYDALHKTLGMRAGHAGIRGFHPNLLRHTAAHRWLRAGGSEMGLMAVAGLDPAGTC